MRKRLRHESDLNARLAKAAWQDLNRVGVSWHHLHDSIKESFRDPVGFAEKVIGGEIRRADVYPVRPMKGSRTYLGSNLEARFHTDNDIYMTPPALQMFICIRPAVRGGETISIDSWALLETIRAKDPDLFLKLFRVVRAMPFADGLRFGPTFAVNEGNLVCFHPPHSFDDDEVGLKFQRYVDRAPKFRLRLKADDVYLSNNHRMLHSRAAFVGDERFLIRFTLWPTKTLKAPTEFMRLARDFRREALQCLAAEPVWIHRHLGLMPTPTRQRLNYFESEISAKVLRTDRERQHLQNAILKLNGMRRHGE